MSDRAGMIVMVKMIKAKIEEQKLCLEMVDDPKTKELIKNRITQLDIELGLYLNKLNYR
jgi:hypothetical protein